MSKYDGLIVTKYDVRAAKVCQAVSGGKRWMLRHGLDYRELIKNGLPAEQFLATGDAIAARLVEVAYGRSN